MLSGWVSRASRGRRPWALAWALAAGVGLLVVATGGCNAISGVGDLDFSTGGSGQGGAGAGTTSNNITTSAASASTASGSAGSGATASGGAGGEDCGPCDNPPGNDDECLVVPGVCSDGECVYEAQPDTTACDDGSACTADDACDGRGQCVGGPVCPAPDVCHLDGACEAGACNYPTANDGTSCGGTPAEVCCGGGCVDISSDEANCGGCGFDCAADETCKSVSTSTACADKPANTSGRCGCSGQNAKCPGGLVCRTETPANNLCSPAEDQCPDGATFVEVNFCPNYCFY